MLSKGRFIGVDDLPETIRNSHQQQQAGYVSGTLKAALAGPEKNIIRHALEANDWNRQKTAMALGINRTTLFKKMKRYGLYTEAERLGLT